MKYCFACENLTKHSMKVRLNGRSFKFPMCEKCQSNTIAELLNTQKIMQEKHKIN